MSTKLNERSMRNLRGVHDDLVRVIYRAAELGPMTFIVTEGLRSAAHMAVLSASVIRPSRVSGWPSSPTVRWLQR